MTKYVYRDPEKIELIRQLESLRETNKYYVNSRHQLYEEKKKLTEQLSDLINEVKVLQQKIKRLNNRAELAVNRIKTILLCPHTDTYKEWSSGTYICNDCNDYVR